MNTSYLTNKGHQFKVAIVDDDKSSLELLEYNFLKAGYNTVCFDNSLQAKSFLSHNKVDLIITDWMMPEKTGPELISELHEDESLSSIPTILLTAKSDEESKMIGTQLGATAYLGKPFDELELVSLAKNLVDLKKGERKIAELNRFLTEKVLSRFLPPRLVEEVATGRLSLDDEATIVAVAVAVATLLVVS